jgi:hypothetical protein
MIRIWIDDVRPMAEGYVWCKSVDESKEFIIWCECTEQHIELINIDHDAGDFACDGGGLYRGFKLARRDWSQLSYPYPQHESWWL